MGIKLNIAAIAAFCGLLPAHIAYGDDRTSAESEESEVIVVDEDLARPLSEPSFVTRIQIDGRPGEPVSVAEALIRSAGVHVRTLGGLGSYASVSIRGASPGQTLLLLDGVPLNRASGGTLDVSNVDLASLAQIEVYRGYVPADLGGSMGGAVNMRSAVGKLANGKRGSASVGVGRFGTRLMRLRFGDDAAGGPFSLRPCGRWAGDRW